MAEHGFNESPESVQSGVEVVAIKPCPFCGSPGKLIGCMGNWMPGGYEPDGSRITCSGNSCNGLGRACYGPDKDRDAVAAWNERASLPAASKPKGDGHDLSRNNLVDLDHARLALFDAIGKIKIGNPTDDKLILDNLREAGFWICRLTDVPAASEGEVEWDGPVTDEEQAMIDGAWERHKAAAPICDIPPVGWKCSRVAGHRGPCAASPANPAPSDQEKLEAEALGWAKATAWHKHGIAWQHLEQISRDELLADALTRLRAAGKRGA